MIKRVILFCLAMSCGVVTTAAAEDKLSVHGLVRTRIVAESDETAWMKGGFGRLRYGSGDGGSVLVRGPDIYIEPRYRPTPSLSFAATLRNDPEQDNAIEVNEAYFRYRPVSISAWRYSVRGGAFFPPISLENDGAGWTSIYSPTPSAINSWLGEELRILGAEGTIEHRTMNRTLSVTGGAYQGNDPIGVLIAVRGWGMTDRVTSLSGSVRLTDYFADRRGQPIPLSEKEVHEIDDRTGWYLGAEWAERNGPRYRVMRYDNRGDPAAVRDGQRAWLTEFWSAGVEYPAGDWTLLAQWMKGHTDIAPPNMYLDTRFASAFVLASREVGPVRMSGRAEWFETDEIINRSGQGREETGHAATLAFKWPVRNALAISGETILLTSERPERENAGLDVEATEAQTQLVIDFEF